MIKDPKTTLQEYLQARQYTVPIYQVLTQTGESHNPNFTVECMLPHIVGLPKHRYTGIGKNRRQAEQEAANKALTVLQAHKIYGDNLTTVVD
jgi:ribonuclease-3